MSEQKLMKDMLGEQAISQISQALAMCLTDFPQQQFIKQALVGLNELELKQRVDHLIVVLADYLPADFADAADVLISVKHHLPELSSANSWGHFTAWPLVDYVSLYGLNQPEIALNVLKNLTPLFSAEFAIRPFITQHFVLTHQHLLMWARDSDENVRRLASEGSRPRLPWGKRLTQFCDNPAPIIPILEQLKDDASLYVRRSVANNLNDIAKDHPAKVIRLCQSWSVGASAERQWLIRHALRSLVKSGCSEAFALLGYSKNPQITPIFKLIESSVLLGNDLEIETLLRSESVKTQKLVIDYRIHHVKANGSMTSKVFKWKNITLHGLQTIALSKLHPFKIITTRKYYAGTHLVELLINGVSYATAEFELRLV
ncbi:MAG: DNA alkylation repair protein [Pseudomonadota bacterium]|nr:DNA alkylation repair protein [Pseudomonadota bacterium]